MNELKSYISSQSKDVNINIIDSVASTGGGGDSDFSIAKVTFISSANKYYCSMIIIDGDANTFRQIEVTDVMPVTVEVVLYKAKTIMDLGIFSDIDGNVLPQTTGGVSIDFDNSAFIITGNGSFTAAGVGEN